jgi:hypothetical protein
MISGLLALALALSASTGPEPVASATAAAPQLPGRLLRFVGEQASFEPIECRIHDWPSSDSDDEEEPEDEDGNVDDPGESATAPPVCGEDDLHYRARYRVRLAIDGKLPETVEFLATGWTEHYANSRHALLYVLESLDGTLLPGGLAVSVYPTVDGDWASCDAEDHNELLEFSANLVFGRTDGMSPSGISAKYPASDFAIIGQEATCIRGRRLPALIKALDLELDELRDQDFPHLPPATSHATKPDERSAE